MPEVDPMRADAGVLLLTVGDEGLVRAISVAFTCRDTLAKRRATITAFANALVPPSPFDPCIVQPHQRYSNVYVEFAPQDPAVARELLRRVSTEVGFTYYVTTERLDRIGYSIINRWPKQDPD